VNIGPDEELGGALMHDFSGQGLSEEIMRVLISELGLTKAWTLIDAKVAPLIRLLEKVDFHVEKILPRHRVHPQVSSEKRDCVLMRQNLLERA
jgi:RimJ/RimL family protein N-acetyltransferase